MIESLELTNFKCFDRQRIDFRPLTLLAGLNSSGKSTVIQSLLLLRQSYLEKLLPGSGLSLNGDLVELGTAKDVLFEDADVDEIGFELCDDQSGKRSFRFAYREADNVLHPVQQVQDPEFSASLFGEEFQYLRAERVGPRSFSGLSEFDVRRHRSLGASGEYTAHFLSAFGDEPVRTSALHHASALGASLRLQVEAWMSEVSPGVRFALKEYADIDLVALGVSFSFGQQVPSSGYRPTNVGFGITYSLPVVVSALSARPGGLLIVENPEAHVHPRGQVKLGELLAVLAASGVQVLIETHSDHVLNGIRVAVHDGRASPGQIALYHHRWAGGRSPAVRLLEIDGEGRLSEWPDGFFDEFERTLDRLIGD